MIEFEHNGQQYRAEKLDAFKQFHITRKIAPLIPSLAPMLIEVAKQLKPKMAAAAALGENAEAPAAPAPVKDPTAGLDALLPLLQPFTDALASLSDKDAEYVLQTCLSVVRRKAADSWTPVWNARAGLMMFDDLNDLTSLWPLTLHVLKDSLGSFIQGLVTNHLPAAQAAG